MVAPLLRSSLLALCLRASLVSAGFEFWAGTCSTGLSFEGENPTWDRTVAAKVGELCDSSSSGYGWEGWGTPEFETDNPCGDGKLQYAFVGPDGGDKYGLKLDGEDVGACFEANENGVCQAWNWSCSYVLSLRCWTPLLEGCEDSWESVGDYAR
ncbi:hypothetical protein FQN54_008963 [Arachnomyces sp. PD_36]|nr:hypothetical protein FQN54_008963 [Arachnomyces sp. PD_36]